MNHLLCGRCQLRARNVRRPEAYDSVSADSVNIGVCSVCLGVLQEPTLNALTSKLQEKLRPVTHDNRLRINTTFPPTLSVVRDRAFALALASHRYPLLTAASAASAVGVVTASERITTPLVTLRESFKWTLSSRIARLFSIRYAQEAELFLDVIFTHDSIANETAAFAVKPPPHKKSRSASSRNSDSTSRVTRIVEAMPDVEFSETVPHLIPPPPTPMPVSVNASISVATAFLAGSYNKWSRTVSQTPWLLDNDDNDGGCDEKNDNANTVSKPCDDEGDDSVGHKRIATSVEDVVLGGIQSILKADKFTFVGGGREDVDVRMLGSGRPFLVEAINPRIIPSLLTAKHAAAMTVGSSCISTGVSMNGLRIVDRAYCARLKQVESDKRKVYRCVIWTSNAQTADTLHRTFDDALQGFSLKQRTPLRVLHRRTQLVRDRKVFRASVVRALTDQFFVLDVEAQAGTYIKEFVHGDSGRTKPSVSSLLGCDADILQLDVLRVSV